MYNQNVIPMSVCRVLSNLERKQYNNLVKFIGVEKADVFFNNDNVSYSVFESDSFKELSKEYNEVYAYNKIFHDNFTSGNQGYKQSLNLSGITPKSVYEITTLKTIGKELEKKTGVSFMTYGGIDKKADIKRRRQEELKSYNYTLSEVNKMPKGLLRNFLMQANQAINNIKTNGGQALLDYLDNNRTSVYDNTAEDNRWKKKQNTIVASDAIDAGLAPNWKVNDLRQAIKLYNSLLSNKEEINAKYDAELDALGVTVKSDKKEKGYFDADNSTAYININNYSDDTVFHEFIHPVVTVIKNNDSKLYASMLNSMYRTEKGKEIYEKVKAKYNHLRKDEIMEEAFVTYVGLLSPEAMNAIADSNQDSALKKFFNKFIDLINSLISDPDKKVSINDLLAIKDGRDLAIIMNLENEFDDNLKKEIKSNYIFKSEKFAVKGEFGKVSKSEDIDTDIIDTLIKENNTLTKEDLKNTYTFTQLKGKGFSDLNIDPIAPEDKDMYVNRAARKKVEAELMANPIGPSLKERIKKLRDTKSESGAHKNLYEQKIDEWVIAHQMFLDTNKGKNLSSEIEILKKSDKLRAKVGIETEVISQEFINAIQDLKKDPEKKIDKATLDNLNNKLSQKDNVVNQEKRDFFRSLSDLILEIESKFGRDVMYFPGFKITSDLSGNKFGGEIDLLVMNKAGEAGVYDYKSREYNRYEAWSNSYDERFGGIFKKVPRSKRNEVAIQTSYYKMLLKSRGINVTDFGAIYVEVDGKVVNDEPILSNINIRKNEDSSIIRLTDFTPELEQVFIEETQEDKDLKKDFIEGKINTSMDIMNIMLEGNNINDPKFAMEYYARSPKIVDENEGFYDYKNNFIIFESDDIEARINQMEPVFREKKFDNENLINDILNYFNGDTNAFGTNKNRRSGVDNMLKGLSPRNYKLTKLNTTKGFENVESPILIAENKHTRVKKLLYFSPEYSKDFKFNDESRSNVFGAFINDKTAATIFNKRDSLANHVNFQKIELGLIAMEMKKMHPDTEIDKMKISSGVNDKYNPTIFTPYEALSFMKKMKSFLTEDELAGNMKDVFFGNSKYLKASFYNPDYINNFVSEILSFESITSNKNLKEDIENVDSKIKSFNQDEITRRELLIEFMALEESMRNALGSDGVDPMKTQEYIILANAVKDLGMIENRMVRNDFFFITRKVTIEQNFPEYHRQKIAAITRKNDQRIKTQWESYKNEHIIKLKAMADSRNVVFSGKYLTPSLLSMYENLYMDPEFNYDEYENIMKLKDPENYSDKSLNEAEREYIRFVNKSMKKALSLSNIDSERFYKEGQLPAFKVTEQSKRVKLNQRGDVLKERFNIIDQDRQVRSMDETISEFYSINQSLFNKFNNRDFHNGLDTQTTKKRKDFDPISIETNIEFIIDKAMGEALNYEAHNSTLLIAKAIKATMEFSPEEYGGNKAVEATLNGMEDYVSQAVKGNTDKLINDSDFIDKTLSKISQTATNLAIVSTRQAAMDSMTYLLGSTSMMVSNALFKVFGGDIETPGYFTAKSWMKAGKIMISDSKLKHAIMKAYSIDTTDIKRLMSRNNKLSMRKDFTDIAFSINRGAMLEAHTQVFIANMVEDGSINAYSVDESGNLIYDEAKDLRLYDEKGKVKNPAFLMAIKRQMIDDESFGIEEPEKVEIEEKDGKKKLQIKKIEDRKLLRGYTSVEINNIRNRSVAMLGAFDKDATTQLNTYSALRSMFKFQTWLQPKVDLYWMERHDSDILKTWKKYIDEFGNEGYIAEAMIQEGIINSFIGFGKKIYATGLKATLNGGMNDIEKRNMSILLTHFSFFALLSTSLKLLYMTCEDENGNPTECFLKHTAAGKSVDRIFQNVKSDMFAPIAFGQILLGDSSIFSGISVVFNALAKIFYKLPMTLFGLEEDESSSEVVNQSLYKTLALYRSGWEIKDLVDYALEDEGERVD